MTSIGTASRSRSCGESSRESSGCRTGRSNRSSPSSFYLPVTQRGGVRPELLVGVCIPVLSVGDTFIVESECRRAESECTRLEGVLPAEVVSRIRSRFLYLVVSMVVTLPFAESTRVESVWMRVVVRVVSCGYVVAVDVVGFVGVVV
jgi:hypothetical protein